MHIVLAVSRPFAGVAGPVSGLPELTRGIVRTDKGGQANKEGPDITDIRPFVYLG